MVEDAAGRDGGLTQRPTKLTERLAWLCAEISLPAASSREVRKYLEHSENLT